MVDNVSGFCERPRQEPRQQETEDSSSANGLATVTSFYAKAARNARAYFRERIRDSDFEEWCLLAAFLGFLAICIVVNGCSS